MANGTRKVITSKVAVTLLPVEETPLVGFALTHWLNQHPCNMEVVEDIVAKISKYVRGTYPAKAKIDFSEWYVGISNDPDGARTKSHKNRRNLIDLLHYKKFYAHSMSNARHIEMQLCNKWGLNNCATAGGIRPTSKWVYVYHQAQSPKALPKVSKKLKL